MEVKEVSLFLYVWQEWTLTHLSLYRAMSLQTALSWAPRLKQVLYIQIPKSPHYTKEDTFSTAILINFRMSYTNEKYSFINKHA